jgi:hypothetical protein
MKFLMLNTHIVRKIRAAITVQYMLLKYDAFDINLHANEAVWLSCTFKNVEIFHVCGATYAIAKSQAALNKHETDR